MELWIEGMMDLWNEEVMGEGIDHGLPATKR